MHRSRLSRALAALLAALLVFLTAEPLAGMHRCPMHDGVLALALSRDAGHDVADGGASHSRDATHQHDSGLPGHDGGHSSHHCSCVGSCTGAASIGLPGSATTLALDSRIAFTRDSGLPDYRYVPVWRQHVLPFQNGPPLA